jgi:ATP-dependent protease HslVU (ClpYQ) peptidase subunit
LGRIRSENDALATGAVAFSAPDADVLCILRFIAGGSDVFGEPARDGAMLIAINRAGDFRNVVSDLWLDNTGLTSEKLSEVKAMNITRGFCLLTGTEIIINDGLAKLLIPPETTFIFKLE